MSKMQRTKGASAEREVCAILRESGAFPHAERDLEQTRGHDNGRDIIGTDPWVLQVKRHAVVTRGVILAGLAEASGSTTPEAPYAACIHRSDRQPWFVTCDVNDLAMYFADIPWTGRCIPVQMTLEEFCGIVRTVEGVSDEQ